MYNLDFSNGYRTISYSDIFLCQISNIDIEIKKLNCHKTISIISELIKIKDRKLNLENWGEVSINEAIKVYLFDISYQSPLMHERNLIISSQMLLILLKNVICYTNNETKDIESYAISNHDYKKIIELQLMLVDKLQENQQVSFDANHFIYANYHLNYEKSVSRAIGRMYYMMEKIGKDINNFEKDIQNEFRDYSKAFTEKYGFTLLEYNLIVFCELQYYLNEDGILSKYSNWRDIDKIYPQKNINKIASKIISTLSKPVSEFLEWATESKDREWDFSMFYEYPFIIDATGNYISISYVTLINCFFEKIFWLIRDCYPKADSRSMAFFGRIFEKYIQDLTKSVSNDNYEYIQEFYYNVGKNRKLSSDAYIKKGNDLLIVEAKGFSVLRNPMTKNEAIEENNYKLFIKNVLQADETFFNTKDKKDEFKGVENVYVISLTMDNINAVPEYYNNIYKEINSNKKSNNIKYYFNFNIDEYEQLIYLVEQNIDIFKCLKNYFEETELQPFSNFLSNKFDKIEMTNFMLQNYKEATEKMYNLYSRNI